MVTAPRQPSLLPVLLLVFIGAVIPLLLTSGFHLRLAMLVWIYAILCMGFNLLYGYTGQISLGQPAFYSIGAYAFAMLQTMIGLPPIIAGITSLILCAFVALMIGFPLLRLRTHYLAMGTLAFLLIENGVVNRWIDFTGGQSGVLVPPLEYGGETIGRVGLYYLVLALAAVTLLLHDFLIRSHVGRALQAIRDDEKAASALGVNVTRYKLRVLVITSVMAALAGICFAFTSLRVDPSLSEFHVLVTILTITVVGGLGTRFGPIVGSIIIVILPQLLTGFGEYETFIYGAFILGFLLFLPRGLSGLMESQPLKRFRTTRATAPSAAEGDPR
ncbi:MAG: branched-chain amino acid ABC transporter permease [Flavobacteriaceae bacterium]